MPLPQPALTRRHALHRMQQALATLLLACALPAAAQTYPAKAIRIVVPFGAGGVADITARTVAQKLSEQLGQSLVIDNRPGAGGVVAADVVAKAEPDGYTLLLISNGTAVTANLFKALPFDTQRDFAPISTLGYFDLGVIAPADSRFANVGELLSFARANPGKLNIGSINIGSTQNLAAELLKAQANIDVQIVPFNGTPAVITALRGGQIQAAVEILGPTLAQINAKALRALGVASENRLSMLADVPTVRESGLPSYVVRSWNGLAAPARTPRPVIDRLQREIDAALNAPEIKKKLQDLNVEAVASTPEQTAALLASEIKRWGEVITRAKIPLQ